MIAGIIAAIMAGLMLGLYALPEKFTKDYEFENTWGMFFGIGNFVIPIIAAFTLVNGFTEIIAQIPGKIFWWMFVSSLAWGIGVMMWGKAINHIGLSIGFTIFIGTIILVGSLIPFFVTGIPPQNQFLVIITGLAIVLLGIILNGKAGFQRQKEEEANHTTDDTKGSIATGILIAVVGGLLATGFNLAATKGGGLIKDLTIAQGNEEWKASIVTMTIVYLSGGIAIAAFFIQQLSSKNLWGKFSTPHIVNNLSMTTIMGVLNFSASATFAFAAVTLGDVGGTVGYAIFNTISVAVAVVSGLITNEWINASSKARMSLYIGLVAMIIGVIVIAYSSAM